MVFCFSSIFFSFSYSVSSCVSYSPRLIRLASLLHIKWWQHQLHHHDSTRNPLASNIEQFRHVENICQLQQQRSNPIKSERLVCKMEPIWWRNHFKSMHHYSKQLSCWVSRIGYRMCSSFSQNSSLHLVFFFYDFFYFEFNNIYVYKHPMLRCWFSIEKQPDHLEFHFILFVVVFFFL